MKTGGGTYLTHVLKGTQSEQCHPDRPHHPHYPLMSWYLQYTRSGDATFLNFTVAKKFENVSLPDLTPVVSRVRWPRCRLTRR